MIGVTVGLLLSLVLAAIASETLQDGKLVVDDMRLEAEALILEQSLLSWKNRVYGAPIDIAQTYEGHEKLFNREAIGAVEKAIEEANKPRKRKALRYFRRYLLAEYIGKSVAPLDDRIKNTEALALAEVDGRAVAYRELSPMLAREDDYGRRQRISDAQIPVLKDLEKSYLEKEHASRAFARELGFTSYNALSEELRSFSLRKLARQCEEVLRRTQPEYERLLREVTVEFMGIPLEKFRRSDILRLFQMDRFRERFPAEKMIPTVSATLRGMGLDLSKPHAITLHDIPLPKKNPRAACYALKVPDDVRLTIKPTGGVSDYETLLHEMGHAQHFAHTETDYFEFRQLGDNTVTEAYAFLMEELVDEPAWIDDYIGIEGAEREAYLKFRRFAKIYILRRYAAKLLYEKELHAGAAEPRALYRKLLSRAYGFPLNGGDAERYLSDVDDFFYVADYLRAWFLKAQLERALVRRFGERWFEKPEAGEFLSSLWRSGQELGADELARKLGYDGVAPSVLFERVLGSGAAGRGGI